MPRSKAKELKVQFLIPSDNVVAELKDTGKLNKKGKPVFEPVNPRVNTAADIPADCEGFDIGPETAKRYAEVIAGAKTILWNGPMGMFGIRASAREPWPSPRPSRPPRPMAPSRSSAAVIP